VLTLTAEEALERAQLAAERLAARRRHDVHAAGGLAPLARGECIHCDAFTRRRERDSASYRAPVMIDDLDESSFLID
jgi:hypothetical protein